jgi:hypothetical protein
MLKRKWMAAAGIWLAIASAGATTLKHMSLKQLTVSARAIVRARCVGVHIQGTANGEGGEIWTVTDFEIEESWKGRAPAQLQIWLPGGRAGHVIRLVPGAPRFQPGEEAILFLEPTVSGKWSITAWGEGTFRIRRDAAQREIAVQDAGGIGNSFGNAGNGTMTAPQNLPVDKLKSEIRVMGVSAKDSR